MVIASFGPMHERKKKTTTTEAREQKKIKVKYVIIAVIHARPMITARSRALHVVGVSLFGPCWLWVSTVTSAPDTVWLTRGSDHSTSYSSPTLSHGGEKVNNAQ